MSVKTCKTCNGTRLNKGARNVLIQRKNIADILSAALDQISVKATTTDQLGFIGKGDGIAATASVLIKK